MKRSKRFLFRFLPLVLSALILTLTSVILTGFETRHPNGNNLDHENKDINGDGTLDILIIGTDKSIKGNLEFSPNQIASELQNILEQDPSISQHVNVVAEDIHMSKLITIGLGGSGTEFDYTHYSHSLVQYYYWPEGHDARMDHLSGTGDTDWDYVVIGADPYIVSTIPGYYSLGVNKIAQKVKEGGAEPLLIMMWPEDGSTLAPISHYEEFTYRTADGVDGQIATIPAGLAWEVLPSINKDVSTTHPTPNGAYLAAASIYSHIYNSSASSSDYTYNDEIAGLAFSTVLQEAGQIHYSGSRTFISPFMGCNITDPTLNYNHTGSSSENGVLGGLKWVINQAPKTIQSGGTSPINFNYGRANSNFEANKRYKIDPNEFDWSFGFPMQDHGNHGDISMLYGIDKRSSITINDTDLGVAQFMIDNSELPLGHAIPIRTLYAQMHEAIPGQSAYRDSWHMHRDLDKAIGAFMFTILTGDCVLGTEPEDNTSSAWRTWMSHKIGYTTAWNLMYLRGEAPPCGNYTWIGVADTDWSNSDNWNGGILPDMNSNVFIPAGVPYYPVLDENVIINELEIETNAAFKNQSGFNIEVQSSN